MFFRVFVFGVVLGRFVALWLFRPEIIDKFIFVYVPKFVFFGIMLLYIAGWCLQLAWAASIISAMAKALLPSRTNSGDTEDTSDTSDDSYSCDNCDNGENGEKLPKL